MLLGNKVKTIKLHAENFLHGNLSINHGTEDIERVAIHKDVAALSKELRQWLQSETDNDKSKEHVIATDNLYDNILSWRIRGRLLGVLRDVDLEEENARLKDENVRYTVRNEQLQKDNVILANELKDKTDLIEQYEKGAGINKP